MEKASLPVRQMFPYTRSTDPTLLCPRHCLGTEQSEGKEVRDSLDLSSNAATSRRQGRRLSQRQLVPGRLDRSLFFYREHATCTQCLSHQARWSRTTERTYGYGDAGVAEDLGCGDAASPSARCPWDTFAAHGTLQIGVSLRREQRSQDVSALSANRARDTRVYAFESVTRDRCDDPSEFCPTRRIGFVYISEHKWHGPSL
ncbi:hypothetical protein EXIGLDRAFT_441605 [Exidia glandulosa HHB12029]|uniref:Uncharacterized protein n=1 Tax=Exidia glandulosa HHB12029 TaxID=1314781 RepID=A0A166AXL9_EXIGL|nr:hypothetical protein EXIGLDRAFT_441605 [Exidia glandulosa HHB12029]